MAQPTLALTFQDFIIRVAEYLGIADYSGGAAAVPTDAHDLELCKRLVNDGLRAFITSNPDWTFLAPTFSLTFVAGTSAYDMPDGFFGKTITPFTYAADGPAVVISEVDEGIIRQLQSVGDIQGDPSLVAFRPKTGVTVATTGARYEAVFHPTPSAVYVVTARCSIFPNKLVNLTDQPSCGWQHDEAVLAHALAQAEFQRDNKQAAMAANAQAATIKSVAIDRKNNPKRLGNYGDRSEDRYVSARPWYSGVDTLNGNPLNT